MTLRRLLGWAVLELGVRLCGPIDSKPEPEPQVEPTRLMLLAAGSEQAAFYVVPYVEAWLDETVLWGDDE